MKNWLTGKDPGAGKDWRQERKGTTEDEMVGWHHWLDGHEFEQALGVGDGQGGLACCSPWGHKELDMTEQLNWTELGIFLSWDLSDISFMIPLSLWDLGRNITGIKCHDHHTLSTCSFTGWWRPAHLVAMSFSVWFLNQVNIAGFKIQKFRS